MFAYFNHILFTRENDDTGLYCKHTFQTIFNLDIDFDLNDSIDDTCASRIFYQTY